MCVDPPFQYQFALRDRLGSTRVLIKDRYFDARDGYRGPSGFFEPEVLQVNDYYPFGLNHETQVAQQSKDFQFEYTGKERVKDLGVNYNDHGARWYNASLGRWVVVDPLADSMPSYSPYVYGFNNPLSFTDPTGMAPEEEPCCDFGAAAQELKTAVTETLPNAVKTLGGALLTLIGDGGQGTPDYDDYVDKSNPVDSGKEVFSSTDGKKSQGTISTPEAINGSDAVVIMDPTDMPGGGGTKVNPVSRVGGTLNKTMPASVQSPQQFGNREVDSTAVITGGSDSKPGSFYMVPTTQKDSMTKVINERGY